MGTQVIKSTRIKSQVPRLKNINNKNIDLTINYHQHPFNRSYLQQQLKSYEIEKYNNFFLCSIPHYQSIFQDCQFSNHPRFKYVKYAPYEKNMLVQFIGDNFKEIQQWQHIIEIYKYRKEGFHDQDLNNSFSENIVVPNYTTKTGKCYKIQERIYLNLIYPKYPFLLQDQIYKRQQNSKFFSQAQLWLVLYQLTLSAESIHHYGSIFWLGSIHPFNILINQQGNYGILPWFGIPQQKNSLQNWKLYGSNRSYLSPECMGFIGKKQQNQSNIFDFDGFPKCLNRHLCDSFATGMTILSMATLTVDMSKCYQLVLNKKDQRKSQEFSQIINNNSIMRVNYLKISQMLKIINQRYSLLLGYIINKLLQRSPQIRLSFNKLYQQLLKPNKRDILSLNNKWINQIKWNQKNINKDICIAEFITNSNDGINDLTQIPYQQKKLDDNLSRVIVLSRNNSKKNYQTPIKLIKSDRQQVLNSTNFYQQPLLGSNTLLKKRQIRPIVSLQKLKMRNYSHTK